VWFVLLSGFVFFAWGEIYSLFPSTCTDTFGAKVRDHQCRPALITAKGTRPAGAVGELHQQSSGTWTQWFIVAGGANILASLLAKQCSNLARTVVAASQASADHPGRL